MSETIMYQQHYNLNIHEQNDDLYNYYYSHQIKRKSTFSQLLLKRKESLMSVGRKLTKFNRSELKITIPIISSQLSRSSTNTDYESEEDEDCLKTPTTNDLEFAVTTVSNNPHPLMDYSGKGYSNFYIRLPSGNWMVRIRDANRKIIATYEIDGSMV